MAKLNKNERARELRNAYTKTYNNKNNNKNLKKFCKDVFDAKLTVCIGLCSRRSGRTSGFAWLLNLPFCMYTSARCITADATANCTCRHTNWVGQTNANIILIGSGAQRYAKSSLWRIIVPAIVVGIKELFEPLQKLEIILEAATNQFVDRYYLGFDVAG